MTADYVSAFTIANACPQNSCCTGPLDSGDGGNYFICSKVTTFTSVQAACESVICSCLIFAARNKQINILIRGGHRLIFLI